MRTPTPGPWRIAGWRSGVLLAAAVAAAYAVGALSAYWWFGADEVGVVFFPSAGVTLAALVLVERRAWPIVLAAAFAVEVLVDLGQGYRLGSSLGFGLANTVEPLVGAVLVRRWLPVVDLRRRRDLALFTVAGAVIGPIVGGLIGALAIADATTASYLSDALHWWAGDGLGVLAVGAPAVALAHPEVRRELRADPEAAALLVTVAALTALVFVQLTQPFVFLVGPVLLWAAFRFGVAGVGLTGAVVAVVANVATAADLGPFAALDDITPQARIGMTQLFLAVVILTSWFFATEIHDRELATAQGRAERTARDRLARLQALTSSLASTTTVDDVGRVVIDAARSVLAADGVVLMVLDDDGGLQAVASTPPMPPPGAYGTVRPEGELPTGIAMARGQPLFYDSVEALATERPDTAALVAVVGIASGGALPLRSDGAVVGAIGLANRAPHVYTAAERALAVTVADQVGQAVGRARLLERERRLRRREAAGRARAELLADVAAALEAEVGLHERAAVVVDHLVPDFADYVTVEWVRDDGPTVLALAHADPAKEGILRELRDRHRLADDHEGSITSVAAGRTPYVVASMDGAVIDRYRLADEAKALLLALDPQSHVTVPLGSAGEAVGAILLGRGPGTHPPFDDDDIALATELGGRVGLALENASLYEHAQAVALRLQDSLLADGLAGVWDLTTAARYDQAVHDLEVGGDWYDSILLSDGRLGLAVGDVVGRGLEAAATMGRLRTALAALAADADGPATVLSRLDKFAQRVTGADCASCCYGEVDPATGCLRYASAGHPPPLLRRPDGSTSFLEGGRSPLLGLGHADRTEAAVTLDPGAVVLFYSDGLVERRGEHLDTGLRRLADVVAALDVDDLDRLCEVVVDRLTGDQHRRDDVVVLAVRFDGPPPGPFRRTFPADPTRLAVVRDDLRRWLAGLGVGAPDRDGVLVTVGEACANATEHAYLGAPGRVEVVADHADGEVTVVVRDQGSWRPVAPTTDRGRGTLLMERLADAVTVRSDHRGTEVRLVHRVGPVPVG